MRRKPSKSAPTALSAHHKFPDGTAGLARRTLFASIRNSCRASLLLFAGTVALITHAPFLHLAAARDLDGRYANSPLKSWFESLRSRKGPCCSDADGTALSDVDWDMTAGHYRVRIEGQWWDVPEDAVITEPNRAGRTMVWPIYYRELDRWLHVEIRCFLPGSMT